MTSYRRPGCVVQGWSPCFHWAESRAPSWSPVDCLDTDWTHTQPTTFSWTYSRRWVVCTHPAPRRQFNM